LEARATGDTAQKIVLLMTKLFLSFQIKRCELKSEMHLHSLDYQIEWQRHIMCFETRIQAPVVDNKEEIERLQAEADIAAVALVEAFGGNRGFVPEMLPASSGLRRLLYFILLSCC
jgi:glycyl-tRNA synthetase (class II)